MYCTDSARTRSNWKYIKCKNGLQLTQPAVTDSCCLYMLTVLCASVRSWWNLWLIDWCCYFRRCCSIRMARTQWCARSSNFTCCWSRQTNLRPFISTRLQLFVYSWEGYGLVCALHISAVNSAAFSAFPTQLRVKWLSCLPRGILRRLFKSL